MTLSDEDSKGQMHSNARDDEPPDHATGLPWPRSWLGVYLVVVGSFVTWVTLLVVLERVFS